jgi:hypothetical protein
LKGLLRGLFALTLLLVAAGQFVQPVSAQPAYCDYKINANNDTGQDGIPDASDGDGIIDCDEDFDGDGFPDAESPGKTQDQSWAARMWTATALCTTPTMKFPSKNIISMMNARMYREQFTVVLTPTRPIPTMTVFQTLPTGAQIKAARAMV